MSEPRELYRDDILAGEHVLITGGGTGLGASMAARCARLGAAVTVCGRRRSPLEETAAALVEAGGRAQGIPCDVRKEDRVEALVEEAEQRQGPLTRLVNNAAGNFLSHADTLATKGFEAVVGINLLGGFHATRAVGRRWIERGEGGAVLSIVTTYAETGGAYVLPSAASKAGMVALTRSLAIEWGPHGIRLNAIAPGPIPTRGAWDRLMPDGDFEEQLTADVPLRRNPTRDELGDLAVFLLSDLSSALTGQVMHLDCGASLAGAASFNTFSRLPREEREALFERMRPRPAR